MFYEIKALGNECAMHKCTQTQVTCLHFQVELCELR